jgi:transcriptional regulator with XRE-family HTH domain
MSEAMYVRDRDTLRGYIRLLRISERTLATRAGVGHATVNHLLSGRRNTCSPQTARAIEKVLDCAEGVFFEPATRPEISSGVSARKAGRSSR